MDLAQDGRPERIDFRRDGRYCEADWIAKEQEPAGRNSEGGICDSFTFTCMPVVGKFPSTCMLGVVKFPSTCMSRTLSSLAYVPFWVDEELTKVLEGV
jgi:hypothetical protein